MNGSVSTVDIQRDIEERGSLNSLSGFGLVGLASSWGSVLPRQLFEGHPHLKQYNQAIVLGRRIQDLRLKQVKSRGAKGILIKKDLKAAREILNESDRLIESLTANDIQEPWLDWDDGDVRLYLSHVALLTSQTVRDVASAYIENEPNDTPAQIDAISRNSVVTLSYVCRVYRNSDELINCIPEQTILLRDEYARKLGAPISRKKLIAIASQLKRITESLPITVEVANTDIWMWFKLTTLVIFLAAIALFVTPTSRLNTSFLIGLIGVTGSSFLILLASDYRSRSLTNSTTICRLLLFASFLFGGEAAYLILLVLGIIKLV